MRVVANQAANSPTQDIDSKENLILMLIEKSFYSIEEFMEK